MLIFVLSQHRQPGRSRQYHSRPENAGSAKPCKALSYCFGFVGVGQGKILKPQQGLSGPAKVDELNRDTTFNSALKFMRKDLLTLLAAAGTL